MADDGKRMAEAFEAASTDEAYFGPDGPCPILVEPGDPRLVLLTGGNASGKSFFAKVLHAELLRDGPVEWMNLSMAKRTEGGIVRAMMFGDEGRQSTGTISTGAVITGMSTCRGRTNPHVLFLDEPDYGLSDGYQTALGDMIAEFAGDLPDATVGLVLVTHSRRVVERFASLNPTCVRVGDDLRPTREWLSGADLPKSVEDLRDLPKVAHERYRRIHAVASERQAARRTSAGP